MSRNFIIILIAALFISLGAKAEEQTISERRAQRGVTDVKTLVVPKGQWIFGTTMSYSLHENDNYAFTLIEGINSDGHTFDMSPLIAYSFRDNMSAGARMSYSRTLLKIDSASVSFGNDESTTELSVDNYYSLKQIYSGSMIWRAYIPLGHSKRFALFNEVSLTFSGGQSKFARDMPVEGTYAEHFGLSLGLTPGIVAFATNNVAIEVNVGLMGINYDKTTQVHNQVEIGQIDSSSMNFKINIFSIALGVSLYM